MFGQNYFPQSATMRGGRRMRGRGFMDFLRGANKFLRKTRLLSTIGGIASTAFPGLRAPTVVARTLGYGRRRRARRRMR